VVKVFCYQGYSYAYYYFDSVCQERKNPHYFILSQIYKTQVICRGSSQKQIQQRVYNWPLSLSHSHLHIAYVMYFQWKSTLCLLLFVLILTVCRLKVLSGAFSKTPHITVLVVHCSIMHFYLLSLLLSVHSLEVSWKLISSHMSICSGFRFYNIFHLTSLNRPTPFYHNWRSWIFYYQK